MGYLMLKFLHLSEILLKSTQKERRNFKTDSVHIV